MGPTDTQTKALQVLQQEDKAHGDNGQVGNALGDAYVVQLSWPNIPFSSCKPMPHAPILCKNSIADLRGLKSANLPFQWAGGLQVGTQRVGVGP
jgi:hypothetical protein